MNERAISGWSGLLAGAAAASLATAVGFWPDLSQWLKDSAAMAGWVQAIGSIGAIWFAAALGRRQLEAARALEEDRRKADRFAVGQRTYKAMFTTTTMIATHLKALVDRFDAGTLTEHETKDAAESIAAGAKLLDKIDVGAAPDDLANQMLHLSLLIDRIPGMLRFASAGLSKGISQPSAQLEPLFIQVLMVLAGISAVGARRGYHLDSD